MFLLLCHYAEQGSRGHHGCLRIRKQEGEGAGKWPKEESNYQNCRRKKLRPIFFSNQLPGFTVITKNLDASKREGTFLYMQFGDGR